MLSSWVIRYSVFSSARNLVLSKFSTNPHSFGAIHKEIRVQCLRSHTATNSNIYCTVFCGISFGFWDEGPMHIEPFYPSNRLLALTQLSDIITQNSTLAVLLSKIAPIRVKSRWYRPFKMANSWFQPTCHIIKLIFQHKTQRGIF